MNPPINERLAYPPVAKANGRVELITAQAREVLNLRRLPAMLTAAQTAALLDGGGEHNIPVLVRKGLLEPLGNPPANAVKYFATVEVLELAADIKRLGRIRDVIYEYLAGQECRENRSQSSCLRQRFAAQRTQVLTGAVAIRKRGGDGRGSRQRRAAAFLPSDVGPLVVAFRVFNSYCILPASYKGAVK